MADYCCRMRRYIILAIVGHRTDVEEPVDLADFVVAWEPKIVVQIKFCPFCGKQIAPDAPTQTTYFGPRENE